MRIGSIISRVLLYATQGHWRDHFGFDAFSLKSSHLWAGKTDITPKTSTAVAKGLKLTATMDLRNKNSSQTGEEFHCCCSVTRDLFEVTLPIGVYVLMNVIFVLTSTFASIANALVLVSIWRTPSLHSPSNVVLFGLAVSDMGVGLLVGTSSFVAAIARKKGLALVFCVGMAMNCLASPLLIFASLATVTAISLDLYLALYLHLRYREIVTVKKATIVHVGIWVCAIVTTSLNALYRESLRQLWAGFMALFVLVTTTAYSRVFKIVRHHQAQIHVHTTAQQQSNQGYDHHQQTSIAQQRKSLVTKFLIYCLVIVCFLPLAVSKVALSITDYGSVAVESMYAISFAAVCLSSALNPLIYCWRFNRIRTAVIQTTKAIFWRQTSFQ